MTDPKPIREQVALLLNETYEDAHFEHALMMADRILALVSPEPQNSVVGIPTTEQLQQLTAERDEALRVIDRLTSDEAICASISSVISTGMNLSKENMHAAITAAIAAAKVARKLQDPTDCSCDQL